ncbi:MAG: hypothetical protein ACRCZB_05165 [Bacteroidales bacterium]
MKGFSKNLSTKQDFINSLELYPEQTKSVLRALIADRFTWEVTKVLKDRATGTEDETHRIARSEKEEDGFIQLVEVENKDARLFKFGFSVEEASKLVGANYESTRN